MKIDVLSAFNPFKIPPKLYVRVCQDIFDTTHGVEFVEHPSFEPSEIDGTTLSCTHTQGVMSFGMPTVSWEVFEGATVRGIVVTDEVETVLFRAMPPSPIVLHPGDTLTFQTDAPPASSKPKAGSFDQFTFPLIKKSFPKTKPDDFLNLIDKATKALGIPKELLGIADSPKMPFKKSKAAPDNAPIGAALPCPRCACMRTGLVLQHTVTLEMGCSACKSTISRMQDLDLSDGVWVLSADKFAKLPTKHPTWASREFLELQKPGPFAPRLVRFAQSTYSYDHTPVVVGLPVRARFTYHDFGGEIVALREHKKMRVVWVHFTSRNKPVLTPPSKPAKVLDSYNPLDPVEKAFDPLPPKTKQVSPFEFDWLKNIAPDPKKDWSQLKLQYAMTFVHGHDVYVLKIPMTVAAIVAMLGTFGIPDAQQQIEDQLELNAQGDLTVLNEDDAKLTVKELLTAYVGKVIPPPKSNHDLHLRLMAVVKHFEKVLHVYPTFAPKLGY